MTRAKYKEVATLLWALAGLLLGYSLGEFIELSARQNVFMAALFGGGIVLWRVNQRVPRKQEMPQLESGTTIQLPPRNAKKPAAPVEPATQSNFSNDPLYKLLHSFDTTPLSSDKAREALNELLMRQQK